MHRYLPGRKAPLSPQFVFTGEVRGSMAYKTDDVRIMDIKELITPAELMADIPVSEKAAKTVFDARQSIHRILHGADDRLLVIIGPCSIHDVKAAKEYAARLLEMRERLAHNLVVVMRVYFEKP